MIAIRAEIDRVAAGEWAARGSPLRHAPHTAEDVATDDWTHPYTRDEAAFPVRRPAGREVLPAGQPHRRRLRRPQPRVQLPADGGVRLTLLDEGGRHDRAGERRAAHVDGRPVRRRRRRAAGRRGRCRGRGPARSSRWSRRRSSVPSTSTGLPSRGRAPALGGDAPQPPARARPRARPRAPPCPGTRGFDQATTQPRPAWSGVMPGPSSWPWSGSAASRRSVSRAPEPGGLDARGEHGVPEPGRGAARARTPRRRPRPCSRCRRRCTARRRQVKRATRNRPTSAASGATGASRARASGPWTARIARSSVTSPPPTASSTRLGVRGVGHHVERGRRRSTTR